MNEENYIKELRRVEIYYKDRIDKFKTKALFLMFVMFFFGTFFGIIIGLMLK